MEIKKLYGDMNAYSSQSVQESQRAQQDQNAQGSATAARSGDTIALSPEAKLLATTVSTASSSSDTRADKVRELKEQVQAGTYKPDIRKAATNLLRDEVSLTD
ncbi:MAG: flagellar biosynthesis anti-sigma factor FlgM [Desulfovibrionaceae bacterium CG1_02_65_16]|nr:MAG: flagellar biosynthesis anti-sigma factor FlgM [Desulfovibrionaceae bacterium CG1_02_65_16]